MQNSLLLSDDLKKLFNCYELYKLFAKPCAALLFYL